MHKPFHLLIILLLISLLAGCRSAGKESVKPEPDPYQVQVPSNFPAPLYSFERNPITKEGFELGRMLFYEPRLSSDSTVSCGNCHQPTSAFADYLHDLSRGVGSQLGTRNTIGLSNLIFQREFFWDGGANHLEITPLNALTNPAEMNETLHNTLQKLQQLPLYRDKFKAAFGQDSINGQLFFRALAQFTGSLVSANSRYDRYIRKENTVTFSDDEKDGLALFQARCASCHATDLFTDLSYRNNGLDETVQDMGREIVTQDTADRGKFRVPSLRNVALTAPFMHDGRFETLKQVLDHYSSGVKDSPTLDPILKENGKLGIVLTENEKMKLLRFLNTLTDSDFSSDPRFSNPFNKPNDK